MIWGPTWILPDNICMYAWSLHEVRYKWYSHGAIRFFVNLVIAWYHPAISLNPIFQSPMRLFIQVNTLQSGRSFAIISSTKKVSNVISASSDHVLYFLSSIARSSFAHCPPLNCVAEYAHIKIYIVTTLWRAACFVASRGRHDSVCAPIEDDCATKLRRSRPRFLKSMKCDEQYNM